MDRPMQVHLNQLVFRDLKECRKLIPPHNRELCHHEFRTWLHHRRRMQRPHRSPHREFSHWLICNISLGHQSSPQFSLKLFRKLLEPRDNPCQRICWLE
ncbi:hypothetical protein MRX96_040699 [Rhipicephalus microplus]